MHTPRSAERTVNVRAATCRVQSRLRRRGSYSGQRWHDGKPDVVGEISRLIETPLAPTRRMKGNRYDDAGLQYEILSSVSHALCERLRQRAPTVVLERMDDVPKSTSIGSDRSRPRHM